MSALEQEILDKFRQLDEAAQRRVQAVINGEKADNTPEQPDWLEAKRAIRAHMRAKYGKLQFSVADLVNEVREERLNDLMDRY